MEVIKAFLKKFLIFTAGLAIALSSCGEGFKSIAERLAEEVGDEPLDYSLPEMWVCSPLRSDDVCDRDFEIVEIYPDGSTEMKVYSPDPSAPIDCFYIYPTVDMGFIPGNHENLDDVELVERVVRVQAGMFGIVCRVFAPFYRQVRIGTYWVHPEENLKYFKKAFADVASAFEYYLEHWNEGRPLVIMGHSQGAQYASYLLHMYFDGDKRVTKIRGSERSSDLRKRLVVALPIGYDVYTRKESSTGGSFSDIPICEGVEDRICVIHYRSFPEGIPPESLGGGWSHNIDIMLADEGYLYERFDPEKHILRCVNPALGELESNGYATDIYGERIEDGNTKVLTGTILPGFFLLSPAVYVFSYEIAVPRRYTATCRTSEEMGEYLAIGFYEVEGVEDVRGDPAHIREATNFLGLHLYDYNLALRDLIEQVRVRSISIYP